MFCFVALVLFDFTCFITVDLRTIVVGTEPVVPSSAIMGHNRIHNIRGDMAVSEQNVYVTRVEVDSTS